MKSYLSKNQSIFLLVFMLVLGSFILGNPVHAGWFGDAVAQLIGWIVYAFVYVIGLLLMLVMWVLIKIAQYNSFITATPVQYGWTIVRDVCNMFFILILLIIAFATILRVERYSFKTLLPKLILMAVLINFSKLICGVFIDFTQVIMLTFVNGFKDIGTGNLTNMLGIDKIMSIDGGTASESGGGAVSAWSIVGAYMLALMYSVIALITIVTMLAVLAMRMIMIWVYVVLSPMAYLLSAFPAGEKYAAQWWEEFSKNLIVGPLLAFFIWLSFVSLGGVETPADVKAVSDAGKSLAELNLGDKLGAETASSTGPQAAITEAGSPDHMIKFIISIAMLVGGLQVSQQLGGQAGGMAGKGMASLQKMGSGAMKSVGTGLKRATGVERVQMAYKSYQDTKASERSVRARDDANKANAVIGRTKQAVAALPKAGMTKVSAGIAGVAVRTNKKIAAAETEKRRIKTEQDTKLAGIENEKAPVKNEISRIDTKLSDIDQKAATDKKAIEAQRNTTAGYDNSASINKKLAAVDVATTQEKKQYEDKKVALTEQLQGFEAKEKEVKGEAETKTTAQNQEITKAQEQKDKVAKWVGKGIATSLGVGLAAVTGGIGAAAGVGGVVGGAIGGTLGATTVGAGVGTAIGAAAAVALGRSGGLSVKKSVDNAGQANLRRAAKYNADKISTKKDELKYASPKKVLDTIKTTEDHHEHAAATAIALEQNLFSPVEAAKEKAKVDNNFKKDDRVSSVMNSAAEKHFIELSKPYSDLSNSKATVEEKKDATTKIATSFENGSVKISDLSKNAITSAIEGIVNGLKDKNFQSQFKNSSDAQQNTIKVALGEEIKRAEGSGNEERAYNAKKKMAYTTGFSLDHFGDSSDVKNRDQKKKFLATLDKEQVSKAIESKSVLQEIQVHLSGKVNAASSDAEIKKHLSDILPQAGLSGADQASIAIMNSIKDVIKPIV